MTPSPTPAPACAIVRYGEQRAPEAPAPFIVLEAKADDVRSFVAERCAAAGPVTVTARFAGDRLCSPSLYDRNGTWLRWLFADPRPESDGDAPLRWTIPAEEVRSGLILRLECAAPASGDTR